MAFLQCREGISSKKTRKWESEADSDEASTNIARQWNQVVWQVQEGTIEQLYQSQNNEDESFKATDQSMAESREGSEKEEDEERGKQSTTKSYSLGPLLPPAAHLLPLSKQGWAFHTEEASALVQMASSLNMCSNCEALNLMQAKKMGGGGGGREVK